jgi:hypothetical protein
MTVIGTHKTMYKQRLELIELVKNRRFLCIGLLQKKRMKLKCLKEQPKNWGLIKLYFIMENLKKLNN